MEIRRNSSLKGRIMLLIDNILKGLLGDGNDLSGQYKILLIGEVGCYCSDVKALKEYSSEKVTVLVKNGGVEISGNNLYIKKYCGGDLFVCGRILRLERL